MHPGEVAHRGSPPSAQHGQHQGLLWWSWTSGAARQSWEQRVPTCRAGLLQTGLPRTPSLWPHEQVTRTVRQGLEEGGYWLKHQGLETRGWRTWPEGSGR